MDRDTYVKAVLPGKSNVELLEHFGMCVGQLNRASFGSVDWEDYSDMLTLTRQEILSRM